MLEVLSKIISSSIMSITGFFVINNIVKSLKVPIRTTILNLSILTIISVILHQVQYTPLYTITIFLLNIMIYKRIFRINTEQSTIACSIFMVILFIADLLITLVIRNIFTVEQLRNGVLISPLANLLVGSLSFLIVKINVINQLLTKFYNNIGNKKKIINIIFLFLLIVGYCYLEFNIVTANTYDRRFVINSIIMFIFFIITYIYIDSRNSYNQLSDEYDTLFSYIQNFEEWIEKEQVNRHEYKNQLAVLRSLTKEENLINKINEILEDNINIKGDVIHKLKELPKGGLKGLMYYKVAIAQKHKLNIEVDVSLQKKSDLKKLSESQIKVLCNLIGIYFDNAIEAAVETRKKLLSLEVYELKDKTKIVISNTFKYSEEFSNRNERGVTTKGKGHGNGLYYANNIISKNKWIESTQEIINDYYIQTITIKKIR